MLTDHQAIERPLELAERSPDRSMQAVQYGVAIVAALAAVLLAVLR